MPVPAGPAGVLDRLVRGQADVLPRRVDRRPGGQRHRQRPGDVRRHAAVPLDGVHPGRGHRADRHRPGRRRRSARRPRSPASSWSPATPRSSTAAAATASTSTPPASGWSPTGVDIGPRPGPGRRRRDRQRRHRRARRRGDELPRGPGVRHRRSRATRAAAARAGRRDARHRRRRPRAARPDPRRRRRRPSTRSPGPPASGIELVERDLPIPHEVRTPAGCSGSTRCRSPTRASCSRSCPADRADEVLAAMQRAPAAARERRRIGTLRRRAPADGGGPHRARRHPGGRPADRRAAAPDLLSDEPARGAVRFAQYAYPPNELGYCGPPGRRAMLDADATGEIERRARQFEGAWSYLELLAEAAGVDGPARRARGGRLLGRQRPARPGRPRRPGGPADGPVPRPGRRHLARGRGPGHRRTTASRSSRSTRGPGCSRDGRPPGPAVRVLDRCRIRVGEVLAVDGEQVTVVLPAARLGRRRA